MRDGLTRDQFGKRTEKTGKRELLFNNWHRKYLCTRCYTTDVDFYEYRIENGRYVPKAFLEVKHAHVRQKKYVCNASAKALFFLAKEVGVKFFIILYDLLNSETLECAFWVWEPKSETEFYMYDETRFEEFFVKYTNDELKELLEGL